ncbi:MULTISPECIES: signal peptide peptidase SppA [Flavobacterium]|uniref:signal peptide peptidase SppA n=1 Tax=Flavobacterium TaxID=237 RepID=UPI000745D31B|nr:signal peptide peptidase SppA [Flavobacterium covae]AMA50161.1 signal peptide peptidase SppA [Flavobacterium covae]MCJ1809602.1 signal peptide peptidase SppA [Flavobacterium covae]
MNFLKNVLASIIGLFIFCIICFFGIIILSTLVASGKEKVEIQDNSVLVLNLEKITEDYAGKFNYEDMPFLNEKGKGEGLIDILKAIKEAKNDSRIRGISILNNTLHLGTAQTKALRDEIENFRKSGKFVLAYGNSYSQKEYYLNSVASTVYLNPVGELEFKGLSSEVMYFKDFQDKTGMKMEIIRHGKYKSAVEPFLTNTMSPENREQISGFLNSIWNAITEDISKSRNISVTDLNLIATDLLARTPELAKNNKLIDIIAYEDVYHQDIKKRLKVAESEDYNTVNILDYSKELANNEEFSLGEKIAIIYAQGEIGSGEGDLNTVGEGSMKRSLKEAREDQDIKAIVLRINSPGGSALTSDLIWREIELTKKVKPVVVSMGNLGASGGYYIACNAHKIFAEASTITGSIGVFGMLPNLSEISKRYGINTETVETHKNASGYSVFEPIDTDFRNFTQEGVETIYKTFVNRVAKGRKMTFEQVDAIAQGRVWSGTDALKIGLVDKIGGLDDAITYAATLSKTKKYSTISYPEFEKNFLDELEKSGFMSFFKTRENLLKEQVGEEGLEMINQIKRMNNRRGIQLILPYELKIN